jgi:hypothetical protein
MLRSYKFRTTLKPIKYNLVSGINMHSNLFMSFLQQGLLGHMEFSELMVAWYDDNHNPFK